MGVVDANDWTISNLHGAVEVDRVDVPLVELESKLSHGDLGRDRLATDNVAHNLAECSMSMKTILGRLELRTFTSYPVTTSLFATKSFHGTNAAGKVTIKFLGTVIDHPFTEMVPPVLKLPSIAVAVGYCQWLSNIPRSWVFLTFQMRRRK